MTLLADFLAQFPEFDEDIVNSVFPIIVRQYPRYYNYVYQGTIPYPQSDTNILYLLATLFLFQQLPSPDQVQQFTSSGVRGVSGSFRQQQNTTDFRSFIGSTRYGQDFLEGIKGRQGPIFA